MSAYWKDIFREIWNTKGRFLSLLVIAALGAASVVGIQATSIDMRDVADRLYKEHGLYDIQIKSTVGFDEDDIAALQNTGGVNAVMPAYTFDAYLYFGQETRTVRAYSLPDTLNQVELLDGRLPINASECAVEERFLNDGRYSIGETITLGLDEMDDYYDMLKHSELTITGVVKSPLYINIHDRGLTTLGSGRLDLYIYLHPSAFALDVYTDIYIQMSDSLTMYNLSDEYNNEVSDWVEDIKLTGNERVRYWENELNDARIEIDDGWAEYYDGAQELEDTIADGRRELDDAARELADAKTELEDGQRELDEQIADAFAEVDKNERELIKARNELEEQKAELSTAQSRISDARSRVEAERRTAQDAIDAGWAEYYGQLEEFEKIAALLPPQEAQAIAAILEASKLELEESQRLLDARITEAIEEIARNEATLNNARNMISEGESEINNGFRRIRNARREIEEERETAQQEIDDGWVSYYEGLEEYEDGVVTLEREEADALAELEDALEELVDVEAELADAPTPEWFYFTRRDGVAFDSYYQDTLRLEQIGFVFPLVFFLVAVMVTLTTMTRMVEEHRTQIGIYKALGFGTGRVVAKYLIYSLIAGTLGGVLGVAGGSYVFPLIITDAYGYLYDMPPVDTPIPFFIGMLAVIASVGSVAIVTLFTCMKAASHEPSMLMRPKPPRSGKRVVIERVPILWNRLGFIAKVTARNIFRYKTRFFMTLIGVAGCAALLVTAFGLRDSVGSVSIEQFGRIVEYDARVYLKDITDNEQREELDVILGESRSLYVREETVRASGFNTGSAEEPEASLVIPENYGELHDFINLLSPGTGKTLEIDYGGVIITEKLSEKTGTEAGDSIVFSLDGNSYTVPVTGIAENYILNYIYMPPELYLATMGEEPVLNNCLIFADNADELGRTLLANDNVRAYSVTEDQMESIAESTDALGIVTVVLIVLACALALVVLFNLTNININERIRELATIKVLGFYNPELALYIYRENFIVTAMGIALGTWAGLFLHGFILNTVEIDMLMFPRIINTSSYVWAAALSAAFAVLVNIIMNFRLSGIDMVTSLKNVE